MGTAKTLNMPINQVEKKIVSVKQEINNIKDKNKDKNDITMEEKEIRTQYKGLELKRKLIAKLKENRIKQELNNTMINSLKEQLRLKQDNIRKMLVGKHDIIKTSFIQKNYKFYILTIIVTLILEVIVGLLLKFVFKTDDTNRIIYSFYQFR